MTCRNIDFSRISFVGFILLTLSAITYAGLTTGHLNPEDTPYCKVNKTMITITPGTTPGTIAITGVPGSISSSTSATAYAKNVETGIRTDIALNEDMSFIIELEAAAGQKVRIYASNRQGKRSYGTFNIEKSMLIRDHPQPPAAVRNPAAQTFQPSASSQTPALADAPLLKQELHTTPAVKEYSVMTLPSDPQPALMVNGQSVSTIPEPADDDPDGTNLAVVIMIVNTDSGQVLSTTQVSGKSRTYADKSPENFKIMIQRILDRCKNVIESEIFRPDFKRSPLDLPEN